MTQGHIGNCYLISGMTSLALKPDRLKESFITKEKNQAGIYTLRFFVRGIPSYITVDDSIYYINSGEDAGPTYGRMSDDFPSFWGPLLEKGWAKLLGNFQNTIGGTWPDVMQALIGCPTENFNMIGIRKIWTPDYLHQFIYSQSKVYFKSLFAFSTTGKT